MYNNVKEKRKGRRRNGGPSNIKQMFDLHNVKYCTKECVDKAFTLDKAKK